MPATKLVSVFATEEEARAAARAVENQGVRAEVGSAGGDIASVEAEMQEEMEHTIVGPGNVGPFTKEMTKGLALGVVGWTVVCTVLALPLALIPFGDLGLGVRLVVAAALGATCGATIGFVLGGGMGAKEPGASLAAERGVTLVIEGESAAVERVASTIASRHPIRLDRYGPDGAPTTVTTEEDQAPG